MNFRSIRLNLIFSLILITQGEASGEFPDITDEFANHSFLSSEFENLDLSDSGLMPNRGNYFLNDSYAELSKKHITVLNTSGGGGRGLISLLLLKEIFAAGVFCGTVQDYVTHYAGNSTGSIIAGGLALGKSIDNMIDFYVKDGPEIFSKKVRNWLFPLKSKYNREVFDQKLAEGFGDYILEDISNRGVGLLIMANQLEQHPLIPQGPVYFDTENPEMHRYMVKDIVGASCSAPGIFDSYRFSDYHLIDGGLIENNPAMGAYWNWGATNNLHMLTIGTGNLSNIYDFSASYGLRSLFNWYSSIPHMVTRDASNDMDRRLQLRLGARYQSINPELREYITIDDLTPMGIQKMYNLVSSFANTPENRDKIQTIARTLVNWHTQRLHQQTVIQNLKETLYAPRGENFDNRSSHVQFYDERFQDDPN